MRVFAVLVPAACVLLGGRVRAAPCESYNITTGKAVCAGVAIDVGAVLCGGVYDNNTCFAEVHFGNETQKYVFKGTPTGLPPAQDIDPTCQDVDFPPKGGLAMAQVIYEDGISADCYPAADVVGSSAEYTTSPTGGIKSVTINFGTHTTPSGASRVARMVIDCVKGGPTSSFEYATTGDQYSNTSDYNVTTTADCENSGILPPGPGPVGYWCIDNVCLYGPNPNRFPGGTKEQCDAICGKYKCVNNQCVPAPAGSGGSYDECKQICD